MNTVFETIAEYLKANAEHAVHVCINVIGKVEDGFRYTFTHRQGPYRPKDIGTVVAKDDKEALAKLAALVAAQPKPQSPVVQNGGAHD